MGLKRRLLLFESRLGAVLANARFQWCGCQTPRVCLLGRWKSASTLVDYGPASVCRPDGSAIRLRDGSPVLESRTQARMNGIDTLLAKHPWLDLVDRQIFLDGFDTGEQYVRRISVLGN